jgi:6,7-dimethyl-8-ribityllumazine synthase
MTRPPHLLLVEAPYYAHLATLLREGAERAIAAAGATCEIVSVPGAFEIPPAIALVAKAAAGRFDGFVALGCVIRGETTHYDHICAETARSLQDLAVRDGLAIGYGILTVENEAQALVRAAVPEGNMAGGNMAGGNKAGRDKGGEAARACLALIELKRRFLGDGR